MIGYETTLSRELSIKGTNGPTYEHGGQITIPGEYYGIVSMNDKKYHAIKLKEIRNNCGKSHDAVLYISTDPCTHPIIKESINFSGENLRDIEVVFDGGRHNKLCCSPLEFEQFTPIEWKNYPDKVFISFESDVQYTYAADRHEQTCLLSIDNELEWQCRSKTKYYAAHALYPFSVVYDVVTIPFQWLLWQIWH